MFRFGGITKVFQLVLGDEVIDDVATLFCAENIEIDQVKTIDVSNNALMTLNFVAAPDYLRPQIDAAPSPAQGRV
jgi:hypothetical protein